MSHPQALIDLATRVKRGEEPDTTARTLLALFDVHRRRPNAVKTVRSALEALEIKTEPDFVATYIDESIKLVKIKKAVDYSGDNDSMFRVGRLEAANNKPTYIAPDASIEQAVTMMMASGFSQLPVMTSDRDVKGIVRLSTVAVNLAFGSACKHVRDCMDAAYEVTSESSIFEAVRLVLDHDCVLVRGKQREIIGIITTSDLSQQFHKLGEPFLLLGEIENQIRIMIGGKFTKEQLEESKDPSDTARQITDVADLTFGEYVQLLGKPERWNRLELRVDRGVFVKRLDDVREIRNDVMHFDPEGIEESETQTLRDFSAFLQKLNRLSETQPTVPTAG
jgi:predicted transcriptional regulator